MKKIVITILCFSLVNASFSQGKEARAQKKAERKKELDKLIRQEEEGALIFNTQSAFGVKVNTDGLGMFYEFGKFKTPVKSNLYHLEIGERKHPKEERLTKGTPGFSISNPFIYGKINNFYYAKLGFSEQRLIGGKGNKNGVAVSAIYGGGLTGGFLKPYYLDVNDPVSNTRKDIKYNNNDSIFLAASFINGSSGPFKGFNEMKFKPGAFAKFALRFDYGRFNDNLSAIEVGINAEYYSGKMPIMLRNKEKQFFFQAYGALVFGRRK